MTDTKTTTPGIDVSPVCSSTINLELPKANYPYGFNSYTKPTVLDAISIFKTESLEFKMIVGRYYTAWLRSRVEGNFVESIVSELKNLNQFQPNVINELTSTGVLNVREDGTEVIIRLKLPDGANIVAAYRKFNPSKSNYAVTGDVVSDLDIGSMLIRYL